MATSVSSGSCTRGSIARALASSGDRPTYAAMATDYERFISTVQQAAGVGREQAERASQATLQTLAERIAEGEARDLALELPPELAPFLGSKGPAERFDVDEFLRRIAEREGVDLDSAERHAGAVFAALGQTLSAKELADLEAELPKDFAPLLPAGPAVEVLPANEFVERVAGRAGLDQDGAWRATEAVLERLAERIAGGEVDDLVSRLPARLHAALQRGRERSGGKAKRVPLDEFLRTVAEREGEEIRGPDDLERVRDHARAVLGTLREAVGEDEFFDVTAQLPNDYFSVVARA
jgi:uncharacterized protein (DUF2267 family)